MKLFTVQAWGNYGGGFAVVRAENEERAREIAARIPGGDWNVRYSKSERVDELFDSGGEGVLCNWETGE